MMTDDDLDRQILATQRRRAEDLTGFADPMPAVLARVGRLRRRRRYRVVAAAAAVALTVLGGAVLTQQHQQRLRNPDGPVASNTAPTPTSIEPPVDGDMLAQALAANAAVQAQMIGAQPRGRVLCGVDVLGSADAGRTLYVWLACGDYVLENQTPRQLTASSEPAVVHGVSKDGSEYRLGNVRFPRQAHLHDDLRSMFPTDMVRRIEAGDVHPSPSEGALLSEVPTLVHEEDLQLTAEMAQRAGEAGTHGLALAYGVLQVVGGPAGAAPLNVQGTVTVRDQVSGKVVRITATNALGRYTVELPPGRYLLSATSPEYQARHGACVADATGPLSPGNMVERDFLCQLQ